MTRSVFFTIAVAIAIAMALIGPARAQDDDGMAAYQAGDYQTAVSIWSALAEDGNTVAKFNLGGMYQKGLGVEQDSHAAYELFLAAARQGHATSQYNVGVLYANGTGIARDYVQAHLWMSLAIDSLPEGEDQELAVSVREVIARRMTPEQRAQTRSRDAGSLLVLAQAKTGTESESPASGSSATVEPPPAVEAAPEAAPEVAPQAAPEATSVLESDSDTPPDAVPEAVPETAPGDDFADAASPVGGYRIQLASYLSEAMAEEGWRRLSTAHDIILGGFDPLIEQVDLDDMRSRYRLKIGDFSSRAEATVLCDDLRAAGADCLVTKIR